MRIRIQSDSELFPGSVGKCSGSGSVTKCSGFGKHLNFALCSKKVIKMWVCKTLRCFAVMKRRGKLTICGRYLGAKLLQVRFFTNSTFKEKNEGSGTGSGSGSGILNIWSRIRIWPRDYIILDPQH